MRQSQEVLGSRLDPRHRTAEPPGRCQCDRVLRGDAGLAAEATTDVGGDDAHVLLGDVEQATGEGPEEVGHLRGDVHRQRRALPGDDRDGVALHRHDRDALVDEAPAHHDVGAREHIAVLGVPEARGQVRTQLVELDRCVGRQGVLGVDDRRERLVVDHDGLGRVGRLGGGVRQHGDHRVAHEPDLPLRQRWPGAGLVQRHAEGVEGRDAELGVDQRRSHAGHGDGLRDVDVADHRVRAWRPHEHHVQQPGPYRHVADERAVTEQELRVLDAHDLGSEQRSGHARHTTEGNPFVFLGVLLARVPLLLLLLGGAPPVVGPRLVVLRKIGLAVPASSHAARPGRSPVGLLGRWPPPFRPVWTRASRTHCEMVCQLRPSPSRSMNPERSSTPRSSAGPAPGRAAHADAAVRAADGS